MRIKTAISYNFDLLCFMNILAANQSSIDEHKELFERFYPLVSSKLRRRMNFYTKFWGERLMSSPLTMLISSLPNFNERNVIEMLKSRSEIKEAMGKTTYAFTRIQYWWFFKIINKVIIPLLEILENADFKDFWETERLPLLTKRCEELNEFMEQQNLNELMNRFVTFDNLDFNVYLCSFVSPHGHRLCDNTMVSDYIYDNDTTLLVVTHEPFHPPYDYKKVQSAVDKLANMPWVKAAYKSQSAGDRYYPIKEYIEENIVTALGINVLVQVSNLLDPNEYFKERSNGAFVVSARFFDYLRENEKDAGQSFEEYFIKFVDSLGV